MQTVETVVCPRCDRVWPAVSEQGIHVELFEHCHFCMTQRIVEIRDKRLAELDYEIITCPVCAGLSPARDTCIDCKGFGWQAVATND